MNRKEVKSFLPILQAFADGRVIECRTKPGTIISGIPNEWTEMKEIDFWNGIEYRIKPETKYRPFKDAEECWNEMLKHQPFGWVKCESCYNTIVSVSNIDVVLVSCSGDSITQPFDEVMDDSTFVDGTPFGVKVE